MYNTNRLFCPYRRVAITKCFCFINNHKINIVTHTLNNPDAILIHLHGLHGHFQYVSNNVNNLIYLLN